MQSFVHRDTVRLDFGCDYPLNQRLGLAPILPRKTIISKQVCRNAENFLPDFECSRLSQKVRIKTYFKLPTSVLIQKVTLRRPKQRRPQAPDVPDLAQTVKPWSDPFKIFTYVFERA